MRSISSFSVFLIILFVGVFLLTGSQLFAASASASSELEDKPGQTEEITVQPVHSKAVVTTRHKVTVGGKTLEYTARAGKLPISDNETGEAHANMFFIAYLLDRDPADLPHPLTFLWNGGPGSSSSLVHLLGFGPKSVRFGADPIDNPGTWLEFTDLVFVDPVGTGYSRPTKAEYGKEFYQTKGDSESVAEFIRVFRNRFAAWDAPLIIGGESFGVRRAAGVAEVLQRRGITVDGVILISGGFPLGELSAELKTALKASTYTAAAFANKKLEPELLEDLPTTLKQAEGWAVTEYAPALARKDELSEPEKTKIISQFSRFTGIDESLVDSEKLSLGTGEYSVLLLKDRNEMVGRYDSRLTGPHDPIEKQYNPTKDPSLKNIISGVSVLRYFRDHLRYVSDLVYQGPFGGGYPPPAEPRGDWMSVKWDWSAERKGRSESDQSLSAEDILSSQSLYVAMKANPALKVFVASGYFDLVSNYAAIAYQADHLDPDIKKNVTVRAYGGGHAIYTDETAQLEMKRDVAEFIKNVADRKKNSSE